MSRQPEVADLGIGGGMAKWLRTPRKTDKPRVVQQAMTYDWINQIARQYSRREECALATQG